MDIKWLEDLIALVDAGSFSKAASIRHVTHPAFGRRISSLESWAGAALVDRSSKPLKLTPAGQRFITQGREALNALNDAKLEVQSLVGEDNQRITVATGRTLARTMVADWMAAFPAKLQPPMFRIKTSGVADSLAWLEKGEADLLIAYHHPSISARPQGRNFLQKTLVHDRLVPVALRDITTPTQHSNLATLSYPYLAYAPSLALAGLVTDHLNRKPDAPLLRQVVECDSADALFEYALKGLGVCWLPWSLVNQACAKGQLVQLWDKPMEIPFEVRLIRLRRRMRPLAESLWAATPEM